MLVSVEDLRRYLGGYDPEHPSMLTEMGNILEGVQLQLETWLNRPVELVQVREVALTDSKGNLYLSVTPVRKLISYGVNVASITVPSVTYTPYVRTPDTLIGVDGRMIEKVDYRFSYPTYGNGMFAMGIPNTGYVVEYIGGVDGTQHPDLQLAIKRVAAREFTQGQVGTVGQRQGHVEDVEVGDNRTIGWTTTELQQLQRYRRRIAL